MAPTTEPPDPGQSDLYWAGVSGWAMLPGVIVGGAISAVAMLGGPPIGILVGLPADWTAFVLFWVTVVAWIAAGLIWTYRGASFVYRLTPTHLYLDFGAIFRPTPAVDLRTVESIEVRAWQLRRLFGVGAVIVHATGRPPVRMRGIFHPHQFADAIRAAVMNHKGTKGITGQDRQDEQDRIQSC
jgi:membrane protein YdbS with pleckstrin-like domain